MQIRGTKFHITLRNRFKKKNVSFISCIQFIIFELHHKHRILCMVLAEIYFLFFASRIFLNRSMKLRNKTLSLACITYVTSISKINQIPFLAEPFFLTYLTFVKGCFHSPPVLGLVLSKPEIGNKVSEWPGPTLNNSVTLTQTRHFYPFLINEAHVKKVEFIFQASIYRLP